MNKIQASDAGVWLDGAQGWHNTYRVIDIAVEYGFEVSDVDADTIRRLKEYGQSGVSDNEYWDVVEVSQEATEHLQDHAPEGHTFEWDMGELSLVRYHVDYPHEPGTLYDCCAD